MELHRGHITKIKTNHPNQGSEKRTKSRPSKVRLHFSFLHTSVVKFKPYQKPSKVIQPKISYRSKKEHRIAKEAWDGR